jgi:hypothetical protein
MATKREKLRRQHWPREEDTWTGEEAGWFKIPRTLPLCFAMLSKEVRGKTDPTAVYLELLSHHYGDGFIELQHEDDHAFAVGYSRSRVRSWRERMAVLEELGFIKTKSSGPHKYRYVLLMHPTTVIQKFRDAGKIPDGLWNAYTNRKIVTGEMTFEQRQKQKQPKASPANKSKTVVAGPAKLPGKKPATKTS